MNSSTTQNMSRQATRAGGFTAIELLVVVSITAVLVAMLLPSLSRAREVAEANVCAHNLKGIMMAEAVYMADNKDHLTIASYRPTAFGGAADITWAGILVGTESLNAPFITTTYAIHANATPMTHKSPLRCPAGLTDSFTTGASPALPNDESNRRPYITAVSDDLASPPRGGGSTGRTFQFADVWYGANASSGSYNYPMWRSASDNDILNYKTIPRFGKINKPSGMVMFYDANTSVNNWGNNRISARHIGGTATVMTFADGHAKIADSDDLPHSSMNDTALRALSKDYFWTLTQ
jgi:type II secretory pathway pseudopilin PulG